MQFIKTASGKEFNPRDLISFLKFKYKEDPRKCTDKGGFRKAADYIRTNYAVTDYPADGDGSILDPNFDYAKFDWGDVNDTIQGWGKSADPKLQTLYQTLGDSANDLGIYRAGELQNQATQIQAQGDIDAQNVQWNAVLTGDGSANTIAFLNQNKIDSVQLLTDQAALMKKQIEAATASGKMEVEADYAGITEEILAGVGKLQAMTVDEYAARGMAFSGTLNRATADIASAGATELAKAMAQKGARLGKLVNDMVAYTAQIDMNIITQRADIAAKYGLEMASLMDKDAQVRSDAKAMLAALAIQQNTLNKLGPIGEELAGIQADNEYTVAQEAATEKRKKAYADSIGMYADYKAEIDKLNASTDPDKGWKISMLTEAREAKLDNDMKSFVDTIGQYADNYAGAIKMFAAGSDPNKEKKIAYLKQAMNEQNAANATVTAKTAGDVAEPFKSWSEAQGPIDDYIALKNQLSGLTQEGDKWYRNTLDPLSASIGVTKYLRTEMLPTEVAQLRGKIASLQPTYQKAIDYQDSKTGVKTPLPFEDRIDADERSNIVNFIDKVFKATRGINVAAYAQELLNAPYGDGTIQDSLNQDELDAIMAFFNNGDRSVYGGK
jgi:hypothetical protein